MLPHSFNVHRIIAVLASLNRDTFAVSQSTTQAPWLKAKKKKKKIDRYSNADFQRDSKSSSKSSCCVFVQTWCVIRGGGKYIKHRYNLRGRDTLTFVTETHWEKFSYNLHHEVLSNHYRTVADRYQICDFYKSFKHNRGGHVALECLQSLLFQGYVHTSCFKDV